MTALQKFHDAVNHDAVNPVKRLCPHITLHWLWQFQPNGLSIERSNRGIAS
jgi:hypothetical protein